MSDILKGQIPDIDADVIATEEKKAVIVIATAVVGNKVEPIVAILKGVLFAVEPEIELRIGLEEAFNVIQASNLTFNQLDLHLGERIVPMPGPFVVKQARIDEIMDQMCTLGLHLKKQVR